LTTPLSCCVYFESFI